ncbi:MAG TPA: DMT family transporter [Steroidobacteraceae bacterium]|nr:DMT family transporter [Steroidobacteraceae bacterium]
MQEPSAGRPLKAIATMILAVSAFCGLDTLLKIFSQHYPPMEVATIRGAASLPFMLVPIFITRRYSDLRPKRLGMHLLRAVLMLITLGGFIYAVRALSLANAYAIFLAAPLIVTALSVPILGEYVGWRRWVAISVGLAGVITMLHPSASSFISVGALAALLSATTYAFSAILLRVLTRTDTTASVVFWMIGIMTVFAGMIAAPDWVAVRHEDWRMLIGIGVFAATGQHLLTEAFRQAPPAVVAPFEYTALLWGILIDWAVWGVFPGTRLYLGGGIVIGSGLYLIWREHSGSVPPVASETAARTTLP